MKECTINWGQTILTALSHDHFSPFFFAHDVMSFDFQGIRRDMMVTCQEIQSEKLESSFHTDWRIFLVFPEVHLRIL